MEEDARSDPKFQYLFRSLDLVGQLTSYRLALDGDQGFAKAAITSLYAKLEEDEPLNESDLHFLKHALYRLYESPEALNAICGVSGKRGAAKKGAKGFSVATDVFMLNFSDGLTIEAAQAKVAESRHLSEAAVKKSWLQWKDEVLKAMTQTERLLAARRSKDK